MASGNKTYRVTIEGTVPLIMHNGQTADPLNQYSKAIKQISGKRKKVDADYESMAKIEWEAGLYLDSQKRVTIAGFVIESCIVAGAKRSKEGQAAKTALFVDDEVDFRVDGKTVTLDEIRDKDEYRLAQAVKVGMARVIRTRPRFNKWSATFTVQVLAGVTNEQSVKDWISAAGLYVGLCDWRPRYGRFKVVSFEEA